MGGPTHQHFPQRCGQVGGSCQLGAPLKPQTLPSHRGLHKLHWQMGEEGTSGPPQPRPLRRVPAGWELPVPFLPAATAIC